MPFIEAFDFNATPAQRGSATRLFTDGLCAAYGISPSIVSTYFFDVGVNSYGHNGEFDDEGQTKRIFIKVHAFPRTEDQRASAALNLTKAAIQAYGVSSAKQVAIYFFDRSPSQVSHGGVLESRIQAKTNI